MGKVKTTIVEFLRQKGAEGDKEYEKRHDGAPHLFVSNIGGCPRLAFLDSYQYQPGHPWCHTPSHPPDDYLLELFRAGYVWQEETARAMRAKYGDQLVEEPALADDVWRGHADFLVAQCEDYPEGAIVEHKATNPFGFRGNRLPYLSHCLQVLAYGRLHRGMVGDKVPTYLFYRSWNNYAEFEVKQVETSTGPTIRFSGEVNGEAREGEHWGASVDETMATFRKYWEEGVLPPKYNDPFEEDYACTKPQGKSNNRWPNCKFLSVCWPDLPRRGPYDDTTPY